MLSELQFERTRRLALRLAGIELCERHRELVGRRSRRLGIFDDAGLDALLGEAELGETAATQKLVRLLTTKFTGFFRQPRHFAIAAEHALQAARQRGQVRLWSAAAATGEEPYSLAMALREVGAHDDPPVCILASDIDEAALVVAARGEYADRVLAVLEPERRARFFKATAAGRWTVAPAVRGLVEFRAVNLAGTVWPVAGPFEVIFCRNVLMYLEACHRYAVLERIASLLAPQGLLLLDPAEHLGRAGHFFTIGADGVYSLRRVAGSPRGVTPAAQPASSVKSYWEPPPRPRSSSSCSK